MTKVFLAGVSAAVLMAAASILPAQAADVYSGDAAPGMKDAVAPAFSWTGFYVGGHAGWAWGDVDVTDTVTCKHKDKPVILAETRSIQTEQNWDPCRKFPKSQSRNFNADGFIGGMQFGYNKQIDRLLLGVEVDLGSLGLEGDGTGKDLLHPWSKKTVKFSSSGGFYGDFTGRVGLVHDQFLIYAKGGAAFLKADFSADYPRKWWSNDPTNFSDSETLWGWTIGGGVEYMIRPHWSLKAEYQHFDFGDASFDTRVKNKYCVTETDRVKFSPTADAVTVGLNYHFQRDEDVQPLK
jgi:outer membrane immunogenic protein